MSQEPGSRGPGRAGHGTQLAGSARQPVGVLACRRPPAHLPGAPRRRPGPRRCRAAGGRPDLLSVPVTRMDRTAGPAGNQHRGRRARRHLHRRLPGAAGRRAGHRVVRPAGRAGPAARADVGVQVRRRLRGRRAHRPRPARPRRRDHELRSRTGRQRLRRRPGPARLRHAQRGQVRRGVRQPGLGHQAAGRVGWLAGIGRARPGRAPRALPVPGHAAGRGAARRAVPVPLGRVRRAGLGVRARGRPAHGRAHLRADLGADGGRTRRPPAARRPGHRGTRRGPVRHRPRRGQVRPAAAGRRSGPGRSRRYPRGWCRRNGCAGPGPSTPTPGACSPPRPPSGRFPAGGTGTSSGSAPATTATFSWAWVFTARCCTSAGAPTRSA